MSTTRGAETPIALDPDGVPIVVDGVLAEDSAAADASESCVICVSRPRAVRFLPCGHASLCQLCTIQEMQRSGQCPVARCSVVQLVAVPVASTDPLSVRRMQTHQDAPEPEGSTFASFAAFLHRSVGPMLPTRRERLFFLGWRSFDDVRLPSKVGAPTLGSVV